MDVPGAVARIATVSLEALGLPPRAFNALRDAGVTLVGQIDRGSLTHLEGLGRKSIEAIATKLDALQQLAAESAEADLDLREPVCATDAQGDLIALVPRIARTVALDDPNDRGYQALARHYGLLDGERFTLEDIGDYYGLTRERIRQLEERLWHRLERVLAKAESGQNYYVPELLRAKLQASRAGFLAQCGRVVRDTTCAAVLGEGRQLQLGEEGALELLLAAWGYERFADPWGRRLWSNGLSDEEIEDVVQTMRAVRQALDEAERGLSSFSLTITVIKSVGRRLNKGVVDLALQLLPEVEEVPDEVYRTRINSLPSLGHRARRVLQEVGKPLHFREIARRINAVAVAAGDPAPVETAQSLTAQLSGRDWFRPIGRSGSWALAEWKDVRTESIVDLMKEAFRARQEASSAADVHSYVVRFRPDVPRETIQTLMFMRRDIFLRVRRGMFELVEWGGKPTSKSHRSSSAIAENVRNVVLSLIEEHDSSVFLLADLVRELTARADLPDSTVRARLARSSWIATHAGPDGKVVAEVDADALNDLEIGRDYPAPITRKIEDAIRAFLAEQPKGRARVTAVWKHVCRAEGVKRPTVYKVIDGMEGVTKSQEVDGLYCTLGGFSSDEPLPLPGLELVSAGDVRDALVSAGSHLTLKDIDVGLFQLGRVFESELRRLLEVGRDLGHFPVSNRDLSTLSRMIDAIVGLGEISKGHHLTVLREARNERAHGHIPSEAERRTLLSHAPFIVNLYMTYILQLLDRRQQLEGGPAV